MFLEKHSRVCYNQSKANDFYCGGILSAASKRSMYSAIPEILLFKIKQTTKQQEMPGSSAGGWPSAHIHQHEVKESERMG